MKSLLPHYAFLNALFVLLTLNSSRLHAQDTLFLDSDRKKTASRNNAEFYQLTRYGKADTNMALVRIYYLNGQIESETEYGDYRTFSQHGSAKDWFKNGQLHTDANYRDNKLDGPLNMYWYNGTLKRADLFENGKLVSGKVYTETGADTTYYNYMDMPEFPGGPEAMMKYMINTIHYPNKARRKNIQGKVLLKFIVEGNGSIGPVEVVRGVSPELDAEAIRAVKAMPNWSPGKSEGVPVRVYFNLPVSFKLMD